MASLSDNPVSVITSDTTIATATYNAPSTVINFSKTANGLITINFQFATAPTADKTLDVYLLPSLEAAANFDVYSAGRNIYLGSVRVEAVTTVQQLSIPLDPSRCCSPYGKLVVLNNATGQTVTIHWMKISLRKVR